ncbi:hypothetical protein jhhlp_007137 [Lomentospora prolificans]|uniref:DUF7603 domain-containing protein n=1 Tax=Lomentospora prolificans TaxID=41688 RepID=A0A2N3N1T5_9PEZI|nr:hypothetical protein jhhlp_007137 [Lomentospora prolificans]
MATHIEHDYYYDLDLRERSGSATSAQASHHQQASDTPNASSEVPQREVSPYHSTSTPTPPTTTATISAPFAASAHNAAGPPPKTIAEASIPPSPSFPSDHHSPSFLPNNFAASLASQRSTRSNTLSSDYNPNQVIKRKPLSATASALAVRYSGPTPYTSNTNSPTTSQDTRSSPGGALAYQPSHSRDTSVYSTSSYGLSEVRSPTSYPAQTSAHSGLAGQEAAASPQTGPQNLLQRAHEGLTTEPPYSLSLDPHPKAIAEEDEGELDDDSDSSLYDSIYNSLNATNDMSYPVLVEQQASSPTLSHATVDRGLQRTDTVTTTTTTTSTTTQIQQVQAVSITKVDKQTPDRPKPIDTTTTPKSPLSPAFAKIGSLFSWKPNSPSNSEFSSIPSPISSPQRPTTVITDATSLPSARTIPTSEKPLPDVPQIRHSNAINYCETSLQTPPCIASPSPTADIEEMEDELKAISAELAASIRREMDLEDLVDRLQSEVNNPQAPGKRTSDYYSDSGISSAKFSEFDQTREEVEKIQRKSEQEKAQLRLELTTKLQDERDKRRVLDQQIKELSDKASQMDVARMNSFDATGRLRDLEDTCEDLRRKLAEEREIKSNFEELLAGLKSELQTASNERDNLRDEVIPQLRSQVEGLEAEAADQTNFAYETTKMQQDLAALRLENENLRKSKEEVEARATRASMTLTRSNSVSQSKPFKLQQAPPGLHRSNTTKKVESKEALSERLKDVEAQRDALHNALKSLLERQEYQNRENEKKIRFLEAERERLLQDSPQKAGYERDIANLRAEVSVLRRRAEDAIDQKWRIEKGLISLKFDLDRADEEIASLRSLLSANDILIPPIENYRSSGASNLSGASATGVVTSETLERAYKELQASYNESLERIKKLEASGGVDISDEKTQLAIQRLETLLESALSERDNARDEASSYKGQADALAASEAKHLEHERSLSDELRESAQRVEQLAAQVQAQLSANSDLRQRLSEAVTRGEADRKSNTERVTRLQNRLKTLEDQLVAAQTASEDRVARHEAEIASIKEAHNAQLRRVTASPLASPNPLRSPNLRPSSRSRLSPLPSPMFPRSPRMPPTKTLDDDAEVSRLRDRVAELETAIAESDRDMQDVIAKMSSAQIEVMALQEERDQAVRQTKKLQQELDAEKVKQFEDRFKTLARSGTVA